MNNEELFMNDDYFQKLRDIQKSRIKTKILKNLPEDHSAKVKLEITLDELNELDDYYRNRNYTKRPKKVIPALKKDLDEQINSNLYECAVGVFVNKVGPHETYSIAMLDGHTRRYVWNMYPELRPNKIYINTHLIKDQSHADSVYFSYNTKKSAETIGETVTGLLNGLGFLCKSPLFSSGNLRTMIDKAFRHFVDEDGNPMFSLRYSDDIELANSLNERIEYFKKELEFLDDLISKPNFPRQYKNITMLIPLLMIAAKYGIEHERVKLLTFNLTNRIQEYNDTKLCDGVTFCLNSYFFMHEDWNKKTSEKNIKLHSPNILKLFECFVNDDRVSPSRKRVFKNEKVSTDYYTMFYIDEYKPFINKPRNYKKHLINIELKKTEKSSKENEE